LDVDAMEELEVPRRLDQPREMDHAVGAPEVVDEVVTRDVCGVELRLRELGGRQPASESEDRFDGVIAPERLEHARADVPGCSDDDDPHAGLLPRRART
jgi:hypothetical protein